MEPLFFQWVERYGIWTVFAYIVIKDLIPSASKLAEKWLPFLARERKQQAALRIMEAEAEAEDKDREMDLQERAVVAQEMIGRTLALIDQRMTTIENGQNTISASLTAANSSLAVLLDRRQTRREDK